MTNKCGTCGQFLSSIQCGECNKTFHKSCVGLDRDHLVEKPWRCPECTASTPCGENLGAVEASTPSSIGSHTKTASEPAPTKDATIEIHALLIETRAVREMMREFRQEMQTEREARHALRKQLLELSGAVTSFDQRLTSLEDRMEQTERRGTAATDYVVKVATTTPEETVRRLEPELNDRDQDLLRNDIEVPGDPEETATSSLAISIDLGTTNTVCAVWRDGRAEVVPSSGGAHLTPSVVAYGAGSGGAPLVGQPAVDQAAFNPENTIYDVKLLMGRRWEDPVVQQGVRNGRWPFQVVEEGGRACVSVVESGRRRSVLPEQVSAAVLANVRDSAEAHLGRAVRDAVVTVPAYFSNAQRQATKDACSIAGLRALRIINEPTAAAIAFGIAESADEKRLVLVYDWGGGTLDVSLLSIEEGVFKVRGTAGDTHLGGTDLDAALADHLAAEFQRRTGHDPRGQPKALRRLLTAAEKAKCALSTALETRVELDSLLDGKPLQTVVTLACFESLTETILARAVAPVKLVLRDAGLTATEVQELLLVGGSTRIPSLRTRLQAMFPGRELRQVVSPDEAVALGAAVQAALLSGDRSKTITDLVLVDVTPLSLGINTTGDIFSNIVPRNTTIPCRKVGNYTTSEDDQVNIPIQVYEGERSMSKNNHLVSEFMLKNIPAAPRGVPKLEVTFEIDADGILHVTAVETRSNVRANITVHNERSRFNAEQIKRFVEECKNYEEEDRRRKADANARNELQYCCYRLKKKAKTPRTAACNREKMLEECEKAMQWVKGSPNASKQECENKKRELELTCEQILTNF